MNLIDLGNNGEHIINGNLDLAGDTVHIEYINEHEISLNEEEVAKLSLSDLKIAIDVISKERDMTESGSLGSTIDVGGKKKYDLLSNVFRERISKLFIEVKDG